jgi:hypothetical protein
MGSELIEYTNILHAGGVGSRAAAGFRAARSGDPAFLRRAGVLDRLFLIRGDSADLPQPGPLRRLAAWMLRRG